MWARRSLCLVVLPVVDEVLHHLFFFSLFHTVQVHMSLTGENVNLLYIRPYMQVHIVSYINKIILKKKGAKLCLWLKVL